MLRKNKGRIRKEKKEDFEEDHGIEWFIFLHNTKIF